MKNVDEEDEKEENVLFLASKYDVNVRSAATDSTMKAHVEVPTQEDIGALVIDEKKRILLEKFAMA